MATQTEVNTETTTQDQPNSPHPSQVPHNSGFSAYTPEGYWQRGTQSRRSFESPSRNNFQGEGRQLRPSSAPPFPERKEEGETGGTPNAPRIPTMYLPTPRPTAPRIRSVPYPQGTHESRNQENLMSEVHAINPGHSFRGETSVPESILEEARVQELLTGPPHDPRSPQEQRTPIPSQSELNYHRNSPNNRSYDPRQVAPTQTILHSPHGSPIRILEPPFPRERLEMSAMLERQSSRQDSRPYQEQYNSVMGSALERDPRTNSSQPKRYPTPRDALDDVGEQCRALGERLGVRGIGNLPLEEHIQAVRALTEAREIDLPLWIASQVRDADIDRELSRLHAVVRQPNVALVVPEDASLPDPWGLTRWQTSPAMISPSWSWQQLEQQRALESERERWRENVAKEVRRNAAAVLQQERNQSDQREFYVPYERIPDPILRPSNPAVPSTTIYLPSTPSENPARARVRVVEPEKEDSSPEPTAFTNRSKDPQQEKMDEREQGRYYRDAPPHQIPAQTPLKPGNLRPEGYKYTPFPRVFPPESSLRQSRRRLREILEDVEGERAGRNVRTPVSHSIFGGHPLDNDPSQQTPVRPRDPTLNRAEQAEVRHELTEEEKKLHDWEMRGKSHRSYPGRTPKSYGGPPSNSPPPPPNPLKCSALQLI
ncbi:hypothetical protein K435DRAFT_873983 [Dendrothele bispora CBS 962.96]|uniref:Uncharacterized protein n=1 Tax=Dendrothele bispora (strain CBS 962.96) TaxID=1314807 RepID=A0A4S8KXS4_DENBC|nr:hypothetical protein K435DRAFT_873983 [Dendrothele bispora CBS 962.96]